MIDTILDYLGIFSAFTWLLMVSAVLLIVLFIPNPMKFLTRAVIQAGAGALIILFLNFILSPLNLSIGINAVTLAIAGFLGLPGLASLYVLQAFF